MPILKSTLKVESTDLFPIAINATTVTNNTIAGDSNTGKLTLNHTTPLQLQISELGAKGAYVYLKAPATNPTTGAIQVYSETDLGEQVPLATLYPGETAFVPASSQQPKLLAKTTYGTADLEYIVANRGGAAGQTELFIYGKSGENYKYFTIDSNSGEVGSPIDTGVDYNAYELYVWDVVTDKGFALNYDNNSPLIFINSRGEMVQHTVPSFNDMDSSNTNFGLGSIFYYYNTDDILTAAVFDGDEIYYHAFPGASHIYADYNSDMYTADGSIPLYIENYQGADGRDAIVVLNKNRAHLIADNTYDNTSTWADSYCSSRSNFIIVVTWDDDNAWHTKLQVFDTNGTLIKNVNFPTTNELHLDDFNLYFYGDGQAQLVFENSEDVDQPWQLFNFDPSINVLIGEDLDWIHERGSNYDSYEVHSSYTDAASINDFNSNAIAISFYHYLANNDSYFLSHHVDYLDIVYLFAGETSARTYRVVEDEDCWANLLYYGWWEAVKPTGTGISYYIGTGQTTGTLTAIRLSPGLDPIQYELIQSISGIPSYRWNLYSIHTLGMDILYYENNNLDRTYYVAHDRAIVDTLEIANSGESNFYAVGSSFTILTTGLNPDIMYYFNTATKKFVQIQGLYDWRYDHYYSTPNRISDSRQLLIKPASTSPVNTIKARMLINGVLSAEKTLYTGNPYNLDINMGSSRIMMTYQAEQGDTTKVNVYDDTLTLLYSIDTGLPYYTNRFSSNKRLGLVAYDTNTNNTDRKDCYLFTEKLIGYKSLPEVNWLGSWTNDYYSWD